MGKNTKNDHVWGLFQKLTGGTAVSVPGAPYPPGTKTVTREEFDAMSHEERHRFLVIEGGQIEQDSHLEFEGALETDEEAFNHIRERYEDSLKLRILWPEYDSEFGFFTSGSFTPNANHDFQIEQRNMRLRAIFEEGFDKMTPRKWLILGLMIAKVGKGGVNKPAKTEVEEAIKRLIKSGWQGCWGDMFTYLHENGEKEGLSPAAMELVWDGPNEDRPKAAWASKTRESNFSTWKNDV